MQIFMGITSADGYQTVQSHLGPDKMVRALLASLAFCGAHARWDLN
jgi:hypothetical protein